MINLKVRCKNKTFWITIVPVVILLITQVGDLFGIQIDLSEAQDKLLNIIAIIFLLLGMLGVTNDPTTEGITDSNQALLYDEPRRDKAQEEAVR